MPGDDYERDIARLYREASAIRCVANSVLIKEYFPRPPGTRWVLAFIVIAEGGSPAAGGGEGVLL